MNLAVFIDEVNEFNGPLWFIPKSHKKGAIEAKHDLTTTSYPLWTIDNDTIAKLVGQGGIVAPKGGPARRSSSMARWSMAARQYVAVGTARSST